MLQLSSCLTKWSQVVRVVMTYLQTFGPRKWWFHWCHTYISTQRLLRIQNNQLLLLLQHAISDLNVHGIHELVAAHFQSFLFATFSLFAIAERALTYSTSVWLANQCSMTVKSWSLYEYNQLIELPNTVHCSSSCVYLFDVIIVKSMCLPDWCYHHPVFQSGHTLFAMSWPIYKSLDLNW